MPPPPRLAGAEPRGSAPVLAVVVPAVVLLAAVVPDAVVLPTAVVPETALDAGFVAAPALVAAVAGVLPVVVACVLGVLVALPPQAASRRGNAIMSTENFPSGRRNQ